MLSDFADEIMKVAQEPPGTHALVRAKDQAYVDDLMKSRRKRQGRKAFAQGFGATLAGTTAYSLLPWLATSMQDEVREDITRKQLEAFARDRFPELRSPSAAAQGLVEGMRSRRHPGAVLLANKIRREAGATSLSDDALTQRMRTVRDRLPSGEAIQKAMDEGADILKRRGKSYGSLQALPKLLGRRGLQAVQAGLPLALLGGYGSFRLQRQKKRQAEDLIRRAKG